MNLRLKKIFFATKRPNDDFEKMQRMAEEAVEDFDAEDIEE